jgi:hypothetical protein
MIAARLKHTVEKKLRLRRGAGDRSSYTIDSFTSTSDAQHGPCCMSMPVLPQFAPSRASHVVTLV